MKIVVGLGNPGREYEQTRHNIGFEVVDELARRLDGVTQRSRFRAILGEGVRDATRYVLAKPQTYMNMSGGPVREIVNWYKADPEDLLVVHDDMDLPLGQLRLRPEGSAGGHNGMKSIIQELGTTEFARLRVGIGRGGGASIAHVLSRFGAGEAPFAEQSITGAADAVLLWSDRGIITAMNMVNRPAPASAPEPSPGVA